MLVHGQGFIMGMLVLKAMQRDQHLLALGPFLDSSQA